MKSLVISFFVIFTVSVLLATTIESPPDTVFFSIPTDPEEYAEWKARNFGGGIMPMATVSSLVDYSSNNGYVDVIVDDGTGAFEEGARPSGSGSWLKLTYYYPSVPWSYSIYKIDDFTPEKQYRSNAHCPSSPIVNLPAPDANYMVGDSIVTVWNNRHGVKVVQILEPVRLGATPGELEQVMYTTLFIPVDGNSHQCGCLVYYDTKLNSDDGCPISTPFGYSGITETFFAPDIPSVWRAYEGGFPPGPGALIALGILVGYQATAPDVFWYGNWPESYNNGWDDNCWTALNGHPFSDYDDTAVMVKWYQRTVLPGDTLRFVTYYGIGDFTGTGVTITHGPPTITAQCNAVSPDPVTLSAIFTNTGTGTAHNVVASINLSGSQLVLIGGSNPTNIGNLAGYGGSYAVNWTVDIPPSAYGTTQCYTITVTWDEGGPVTENFCINVPTPISPPSPTAWADDTMLCLGECTFLHATTGVPPGPVCSGFSTTFEPTNGGFTSTGDWQWGMPTSGPGSAYSAPNCWATNLAGNYSNNSNSRLTSPNIDLTGCATATLTFWHWYNTETWMLGAYDGGNVKVSTNGGATWNLLTPVSGYPYIASATTSGIPLEGCYAGSSGGWVQATFNLDSYVGNTIQLRWHFGSDGSVNSYPGWYIDNVTVTGTTGGGVSWTWYWSPTSGLSSPNDVNTQACPTTTTTYTFTVTDGGVCTGTATVRVHVNQTPIVDVRDTSICYGESATLMANITGPYTSVQWSNGVSGVTSINISPTMTTTYWVDVCNADCCDRDTAIVTVSPQMTLECVPESARVCAGEYVSLTSNLSGGIPTYTYQWNPDAGLSDPNIPNPIASPTASTWYYLTVTDYIGCQVRDSVYVEVVPAPVTPTLISIPNGTSEVPPGDVCLYWNSQPTPGVTYTFYVNGLPYVSDVTDTFACMPVDCDQTYNWYVVAENICGSSQSPVWTFQTSTSLSGTSLVYPSNGAVNVTQGTINFRWSSPTGSSPVTYDFYMDGVVVASGLTTTNYPVYIPCGQTHTWFVVASNICGAETTEIWTFSTEPCGLPTAVLQHPFEGAWSACADQAIIIWVFDTVGIDTNSIRFSLYGNPISLIDERLFYINDTLYFYPDPLWNDGDSVWFCIDSAANRFGVPIIPWCSWFRVDLSSPVTFGEYPTGVVSPDLATIGFHIVDSLSGLNNSSVSAIVVVGPDTFAYSVDSGMNFAGDSFWFDVSSIAFRPGDSVLVCISAYDNPDYCPPNTLYTCWNFSITPCDLVVNACEDVYICPGDSVKLGYVPLYTGGTPPYSIEWQTVSGIFVSNCENPYVFPLSTTSYVVSVLDANGCSASDTVSVFIEFYPVTTGELLYPPPDTMLPPGTVQLCWRVFDGTRPIYYDVIFDGDTIVRGITDTCYNVEVSCGETHTWGIVAYNYCSSHLPDCGEGPDSTFHAYFADSIMTGWSGDPPFYTYPCAGPVGYIVRPLPLTWSSCNPETIIMRIEDEDGIVESTIVLRVEDVEYTTSSSYLTWSEPYLYFTGVSFLDGDTVNVCLISAEDIYGNPLSGDSLCWNFYIDRTPPNIRNAYPPDDTILFTSRARIAFEIEDWGSKPDTSSIQVIVNGTVFSTGHPCLHIVPGYCAGHCYLVYIDSTCVLFSGCDTIDVRVVATDNINYCADNVMDTSWQFYTDCEGPHAEAIYVPPNMWSSCVGDSIVIHLWDSLPGVDPTSIVLNITGYGAILWGSPGLTYNSSTGILVYRPFPPLPNWGTITVTLIAARDLLGNALETPLSWSFFLDRIPPMALNWTPTCGETLSLVRPNFSIVPYDSGCGVIIANTELTINDTLHYTYDGSIISFDGARIRFNSNLAGIRFTGGDVVRVCWHLEDCADDICSANEIDTCCTYHIRTGGPQAMLPYPNDSDWVACVPDSIPVIIEDDDGIIPSSVQLQVCRPNCSDCNTFTLIDPEITHLDISPDAISFWFDPNPYVNGETLCITVISATDSLGNTLSYSDSLYFYIDIERPVITLQSPLPGASVSITAPTVCVGVMDNLSGLNLDDMILQVDGVIYSFGHSALTWDGSQICFRPDWVGVSWNGGDTVNVCIHAEDSPDVCGPNVLDSCWFFIISPGGPIGSILHPGDSIVSACVGESVIVSVVDGEHDNILDATLEIWVIRGDDTTRLHLGEFDYSESTPGNGRIRVLPNPADGETLTVCLGFAEDTLHNQMADIPCITFSTDYSPFVASGFSPSPGSFVATRTPIISAYVLDNITGIDTSSIVLTVNGVDYPLSSTSVWVSNDTVYFDPEIAGVFWSGGDCVDVSVYAYDQPTPGYCLPNDTSYSWQFCISPGGPTPTIERPFNGAYSSCPGEFIMIRITDPDGVDPTSMVLNINSVDYYMTDPQMRFNNDTLYFIPSPFWNDGQVINVCLTHALDMLGNDISAPLCWSFTIDLTRPWTRLLEPTAEMVRDNNQDISILVGDNISGVDSMSVEFWVNGTMYRIGGFLWTVVDSVNGGVAIFRPEDRGVTFSPGDTVCVRIYATDTTDYCDDNYFDTTYCFRIEPQVACLVYPNPFSPNGDNRNDYTVFNYPGMFSTSAELKIYNVRNQLVFSKAIPVQSTFELVSTRAWDGRDNNGDPVPQGLYLWIIVKDNEVLCNGTVVVAR